MTPPQTNPDPNIIYDRAIAEHPKLDSIPKAEIKSLIETAVNEIVNLEAIGERDKERFQVSNDTLRGIGAVWIISGPGTYDTPIKQKEYKYNSFPWARGMDKERLNHGASLVRKVAELNSGGSFNIDSLKNIKEKEAKLRQLIEEFGPQIIYNGTALENNTVASVLERKDTIIPKDKVNIIRGDIVVTLDQIKTFKLPQSFTPGQELAIVSHAPQFTRILRMLNANPPFPKGTKIRVFPLPTIEAGKKQYGEMEVMGLLRYIYLDKAATVQAYPYRTS